MYTGLKTGAAAAFALCSMKGKDARRLFARPRSMNTLMIAHLRGKLIFKQPGQAIVEAGGVGYDVAISVPTFTALPSVGAEAALHIHTQVSDDQIALFGFLDREEKRLFERPSP